MKGATCDGRNNPHPTFEFDKRKAIKPILSKNTPYPHNTLGAEMHRAICPNETVGAVPVCPPERPRSGVSIPKIHALCTGYLATDAPLLGDTGGHTGTAPTHLHHIFPHKQNNHLRAIYPNEINRPTHNPPKRRQPPTRNLPKRNRRGGAYVPARTSAQRRFHTKNTRIVCGEFNDECALAGRHGRAHRHRPYPTSSNFQRMRTFMAEYPKKVSGCGLSRLNTPKR